MFTKWPNPYYKIHSSKKAWEQFWEDYVAINMYENSVFLEVELEAPQAVIPFYTVLLLLEIFRRFVKCIYSEMRTLTDMWGWASHLIFCDSFS